LFFDATEVARQILAAPPAGSGLETVIAASQRLRVRGRRQPPLRQRATHGRARTSYVAAGGTDGGPTEPRSER
jgi:hypothetical protein